MSKINQNQRILMFAASVFVFCYFAILLGFFYKPYEVPDFYNYFGFAGMKLPAKDGFGTLFLLLSRYMGDWAHAYQIGSLAAQSLALFLLFILFPFERDAPSNILYMLLVGSFGCWWYFYGKVYYEFPYIALFISIAMYCLKSLLIHIGPLHDNLIIDRKVTLAFLVLGLTLSMKPHAIFPVAGIVALLGCRVPVNKWMKVRLIGFLGGTFLLGYVLGNFGLLYDPVQTINGIRAYPAESNFIGHILNGKMTAWDHVYLTTVNVGGVNLFVALIVLFFMPLVTNNKFAFLVVNSIFATCYFIFITYFSTGYIWHSFSFLMYLICALAVMLSYVDGSLKIRGILLILVFVQLVTNYANYQYQARYFSRTDIAYKNFIKDHDSILRIISDYESEKKSKYCVDILLKRTPVQPSERKKFEFDNQGVCDSAEYRITVVDRGMQDLGLVQLDKRKPIEQLSYKDWIISVYATGI